jgi:hypothetical protein
MHFLPFIPYTGCIGMNAKGLKDSHGFLGKNWEKENMMIVAGLVLPRLALESFTLISVLLATTGTLFLAYDLLGRENGPLRWFTLVITCGIVSALIFVPVVTLFDLLLGSFDLSSLLSLILIGGLMGFYTVILVELPQSPCRPPIFSWKGCLLGLALALAFWLVGVLAGPQYALPALVLGLACALLTSTWQRLTWEPAQIVATPPEMGQSIGGEETPASTLTVQGARQFEAWKPVHPKPHVFSRKGLVLGLLLGFLIWFVIFFTANKDLSASLLESVPLTLISGVICGTWRFINWEPAHPTTHLFSRKGFWTGLVAGFVPWLLFGLVRNYAELSNFTGLVQGFAMLIILCIDLCVVGFYALANATAGSIAQYTLWRANTLPHRTLGAIGLVLIIVAFGLQGVQPTIYILNNR